MFYDATIVSVEYKAKGRVPGSDAPTRLPLTVCVYFHASERGLPGFDTPLCEFFEVESLDDLSAKSLKTWEELERKAHLYTHIKHSVEFKKADLGEFLQAAKPQRAQDSTSVTDTASTLPSA